MIVLVALLAATTTALPSTRLTGSARLEARGASQVDAAAYGGMEATPELKLHGRYGRTYVDANYAPRLLLAVPTAVNPWHSGRLGLSYSPRPEQALQFDQQLSYGYADFAYRMPDALDEQALRAVLTPRPRAISDFLESNTDLTFWARLSPRLTGSLSAGFGMSGGRSDASQDALPLQRTPYVGGKVNVELSSVDTLSSEVGFSRTQLQRGDVMSVAQATEQLAHVFKNDVRVHAGAGLALMQGNAEPWEVFPVLRAGASREVAVGRSRIALQSYGRLAPWVNPLTGVLVKRAELVGSAALPFTRELAFRAFAGAGATVFEDASRRGNAVMFGADGSYRITHDFQLFTAGAVQNQWEPSAAPLPQQHWTVSAGIRWQQDDRFGLRF